MSKIAYPKGRMLLVRDCTVAICLDNNPGATLLSVLLFWYDNPHKGDFYDKEKGTFTVCRTQEDIQEQACNQIDVKTIHDVAVPFLQLFGFLDIKEKMYGNIYTIHIRRVEQAFAAFSKGAQTLKQFLKSSLQLEKFLIELTEDELEISLINKRFLLFQLEKVLIRNREISNCKRGRKPKPQAAAEAISEDTETIRDIYEIDTKRNKSGAFAPADFLPSEEIESSEEDEAPTVHRMPAIKLNGKSPSQQTLPPMEPAAPESPPAGTLSGSAQEAAAEDKKEIAKQRKARLEKRKDEVLALYCELLGRKIVRTKDNLDGAKLLAESDATDAEITQTYKTYKDHTFWGKQLHLRNIARLLDTTVTSGNGAHVPAKPKARPKPEDKDISIFEYDSYWQVWKRKNDDQEWIWWQGEFWTPEEADERGYNGGAGLYVSNQPQTQQYGGVN